MKAFPLVGSSPGTQLMALKDCLIQFLLYSSFVSEHIETLEDIDKEYKHLALESNIKNWGRVPAPRSSFIIDLADAVIEALPFVKAMYSPSISKLSMIT